MLLSHSICVADKQENVCSASCCKAIVKQQVVSKTELRCCSLYFKAKIWKMRCEIGVLVFTLLSLSGRTKPLCGSYDAEVWSFILIPLCWLGRAVPSHYLSQVFMWPLQIYCLSAFPKSKYLIPRLYTQMASLRVFYKISSEKGERVLFLPYDTAYSFSRIISFCV